MIRSSLCGCIFLGTGCLAGFFLLAPALGRLLFHSSLAGEFIRTLSWMCPFLYANSALISIIHGLGKTGISFLLNTLSLFHSDHWCLIFYSILGNPRIPALPSGKPDIPFHNWDFVYKLSFTPDAFELSLQHIKEC